MVILARTAVKSANGAGASTFAVGRSPRAAAFILTFYNRFEIHQRNRLACLELQSVANSLVLEQFSVKKVQNFASVCVVNCASYAG